MSMRFALLALVLAMAGCAGETADHNRAANAAGTSAAGTSQGRMVPGPGHSIPASMKISRPGALGFASLPDRGELVGYPAKAEVRHDGAYTWHRADISELHALRAIGGVLRLKTPSGQDLSFQYERHVEHASGDWTWVGRLQNGASADEVVLTFGDKATFGTISQPGKAPLKLMVQGGQSWLIETDRSKIAGIDNSATQPRKPDFLIPSKIKAGFGASTESSPAAAVSASESAQAAATTTVVDVLLGYTNGFAAAQGGQSQAVTRLNNMVEITNQAYANSQVDARVRLVHAMQVSYPDNTSNDSTLEALTGFRAPSTRTTPDPAFAALRSAREQYGADLVSLVRQFNTPENDGCGIAWLIGGGQSGIDRSDEFFGYSVVSDGRDAGTDGKTYFCREETLAHEFGHNMGSQHDRVAATVDGSLKYGVYPYSFGYKTGTGAGNFYTVMAAGDSGQTTYRIFSNPRSTFCGAPCGQVDMADNARSLAQTMPIIVTFRATVVTSPSSVGALGEAKDIDGDSKADLLWHNPATRELYYWLMDGATVRLGKGGVAAPANTTPRASGDFNRDGRADVVLMSGSDIWIYLGNAAGTFNSAYVATYPVGWNLAGAGDIDADGRTDLIWHNPSTGELYYWLMDGGSIRLGRGGVLAPPNSRPRAIGDFNRDGRADIVLATGSDIWMYLGNSAGNFTSAYVAVYPAGWNPVGASDIDADGKADLAWHNPATGELYYWLMDGGSIRLGRGGGIGPANTTPRAIGDFNRDGRADVVFASASDIWMYVGNGSGAFTSAYVATYPVGWNLL